MTRRPPTRRNGLPRRTEPRAYDADVAAKTPTRVAGRTDSRALSWLVLFAALAVALVSLLSTDLFVRLTGLLVVALGGVTACLFAWRDAQRTIRLAEQTQLADLRQHGEKLHAERAQHLRVLEVLKRRGRLLEQALGDLRAENGRLQQTVSALRGNNESLRIELELARALEQEAELVTLPRRASGTVDALSAGDLWTDANSPTVVDLQALAAPYVDDAVRHLA